MSDAAVFRSSFKEPARKSASESNLNDELPLNDAERMIEKLETMKVRKNALEETLEKKLNELKSICLREGELTGVLPKEFPLKENEEPPVIRRRIRTEFAFSDKLLMQPKTKEEEKLTKLELEFEIQCKIVKATSKLCNELNTKKSIRKQRRQVYQQALAKLKDIEKNLQLTKRLIEESEMKMKRKNSMRLLDVNSDRIVTDQQNEEEENLKNRHTFDQFKEPSILLMSSAPSTPVKCKSRNKKFAGLNQDSITDQNAFLNPRIENLIKQRHSNNNSPEYDTISSAASSLGSANNVFSSNYCKINNYEELLENLSESEIKKSIGVTKRSAIAPNLSQDDSNLMNRRKVGGLISSLDKYTNERLRSLTRHNSLDKMRQQETLKENVELKNRMSSTNLLSPNLNKLQANQFNFGLNKNVNNKSQSNINMAQRPLPSPPTEHKKTRPQQLNLNKEKAYPPPLNFTNPPDHCLLKNYSTNVPSLIKNPLKSPSTVSMLMQSPLDFEKAANLYLQQRLNSSNENGSNSSSQMDTHISSNQDQSTVQLNETTMKPLRNNAPRAQVPLTINTCTNDLQSPNNQQHSPVPLLPPRTPIISKPNNLMNSLNPNFIHNSISNLNLSSYQTSKFTKHMMISSNPNLNHASNSSNHKHEKLSKGWTETCVDTFVMPNMSINHASNFVQNSNFYSMNSANLLLEPSVNKLNIIKHAQSREKEIPFVSCNQVPIRHPPTLQSTDYLTNNQLINENSQLSLSSNSMLTSSNSSSVHSSNASSSNLNSFPPVFQPFLEEIKPYELSDFYKYSVKYKNSQKNLKKEPNNEHKSPQPETQSSLIMDKMLDKNDSSDHSGLVEDSFLAKNHVANEFSTELKDWLKEKYNNKTATLV